MIVTCPKCESEITKEPCNNCGFLKAVKRSEKFNKYLLQFPKKTTREFEKIEEEVIRKIRKCERSCSRKYYKRSHKTDRYPMKVYMMRLVKIKSGGYGIKYYLQCKVCSCKEIVIY